MFFLPNVVTKQLKRGLPWEFQTTENITDEIRHTLTARQAFYRHPKTNHSFYTFVEGASDVQRCTADKGENPPRLIHAVVGDYDLRLNESEILAGIEKMGTRKPTRREVSLGGKFRLIWEFEQPLRVLNAGFAVAALKYLQDWLPTNKLPGLDEPAFIDPTKTYCNGGVWFDLSPNPKVSADEVQGLFVHIARDFAHRGPEAGPEIPFDVVYKALQEKYPALRWPSEFVLNSQGPSFWVEGSTSPMSAILKESGFITFAGHADRTFYSWRDLLGSEFVEKYELQTLSEATKDIFYDGKQFWRVLPSGIWVGESFEEVRQYLKIDCGVSAKAAGAEASQLDRCLQHLRNYNRVDGAAPVVFRPSGCLTIDGAQFLNTWRSNVVQPVSGTKTWTDAPFLNTWLTRLFVSGAPFQWIVSWMAYFYQSVLEKSPLPGQALFLAGEPGTGKSLYARYAFGGLLGKFADASSFLMGSDSFNSELFEAGLWCIDDETVSGDDRHRRQFASMVKKVIANSDFRHNRKYAVASKVEWVGRLIVTLNFDQTSNRMLLDPEASMMDKVALLRTADRYTDFTFPDRTEITKLLIAELPILARILADWKIPSEIRGDARYGLVPHHDTTMVEQAEQSSAPALFKELLTDWRNFHFKEDPRKEFWEGTTTQLVRAIAGDFQFQRMIERYKPEQVGRLLASLRAQGLHWLVVQSAGGNRIWRVYREGAGPAPISTSSSNPALISELPITITNTAPNPFGKSI